MTEAQFEVVVQLLNSIEAYQHNILHWVIIAAVCCGLGLGVLVGAVVWRFFGVGPFQGA